jgi:hypothetical protein
MFPFYEANEIIINVPQGRIIMVHNLLIDDFTHNYREINIIITVLITEFINSHIAAMH